MSPKFLGRSETQQYNQGCEELRNMLIYPQGGAGRRPGTISKLRYRRNDGLIPLKKCALFPFLGTDGSRWQLMLNDQDPTVALAYSDGKLQAPWRAINVSTG